MLMIWWGLPVVSKWEKGPQTGFLSSANMWQQNHLIPLQTVLVTLKTPHSHLPHISSTGSPSALRLGRHLPQPQSCPPAPCRASARVSWVSWCPLPGADTEKHTGCGNPSLSADPLQLHTGPAWASAIPASAPQPPPPLPPPQQEMCCCAPCLPCSLCAVGSSPLQLCCCLLPGKEVHLSEGHKKQSTINRRITRMSKNDCSSHWTGLNTCCHPILILCFCQWNSHLLFIKYCHNKYKVSCFKAVSEERQASESKWVSDQVVYKYTQDNWNGFSLFQIYVKTRRNLPKIETADSGGQIEERTGATKLISLPLFSPKLWFYTFFNERLWPSFVEHLFTTGIYECMECQSSFWQHIKALSTNKSVHLLHDCNLNLQITTVRNTDVITKSRSLI